MGVVFDKLLGQPLLHTHLGSGVVGAIVATGNTNPASGTTGELFYNTLDSTLYIWLGEWTAIGSSDSHTGSDVLLEDGTFWLLEDGTSTLLLEG